MANSNVPHKSKAAILFEALLWIAALLAVGTGLYYAYVKRHTIAQTIREGSHDRLAIATIPDGATILLDGKIIGQSPTTVMTGRGSHIITARLEGYETISEAFDLDYDLYGGRGKERSLREKAAPWVLNIELKRISTSQPKAASTSVEKPTLAIFKTPASLTTDTQQLRSEIKNLRSLILANPEDQLSYGILKGRIEAIERQNSVLASQITTGNDLRIAIVAILVGIFLAVVAQIFRHRQ